MGNILSEDCGQERRLAGSLQRAEQSFIVLIKAPRAKSSDREQRDKGMYYHRFRDRLLQQ